MPVGCNETRERQVSWSRELVRGVLIVAAYVIGGRLGLLLSYVHGNVTLVWPPTGIALAALLSWGLRQWPAVALGAFLVTASTGAPVMGAIGTAFSNTFEVVVGAHLLRQAGLRCELDRIRDVVFFVAIGALLPTILGAAIGTLSLYLTGVVPAGRITEVMLVWWLGDAMGALIVCPALLTWATPVSITVSRGRWRTFEAIAAFGLLLAASLFDFSGLITTSGINPMLYSVFPFVMWTAVRFGQRGAAAAHLLLTGIAVCFTAAQIGPFANVSVDLSLMYLHSYAAVVVMTSLLLGAAITERQGARDHAELRALELRVILDTMVDGVVVSDSDRRITMLNATMHDLFGLKLAVPQPRTLDELRARTVLRDTNAPEVPLKTEELPLALAMKTGRPVQRRLIVPRSGAGSEREILLDVLAAPIHDENRNLRGAVAVWRDVSEAARFEHVKQEFIRVAAHELKTPVATVRGYAESILRSSPATPLRSKLEAIIRGADRIARITADMLDVSQLQVGQLQLFPKAVNLSDILGPTASEAAQGTTDHRIQITGQTDAVVVVDEARVVQVLRALLSNAIKYSPAGGDITVHVEPATEEVRISVTDRGIGIPARDQARIFECFFRAHSGTAHDRGGLGVGLYIAREIVQMHGGRMWFETQEDAGSTFTFTLPRHMECEHGAREDSDRRG